MLAQGMNCLLDIKQDLLLTPMAEPLPAISNIISLIFVLLHYVLWCGMLLTLNLIITATVTKYETLA